MGWAWADREEVGERRKQTAADDEDVQCPGPRSFESARGGGGLRRRTVNQAGVAYVSGD